MQEQSERCTRNHFSDPHGQHHKRDGKGHHVAISQYEWYDELISNDWRQRSQIFAPVTQLPCKYRPDQGRKTSENDIRKDASAEDIADKASDK